MLFGDVSGIIFLISALLHALRKTNERGRCAVSQPLLRHKSTIFISDIINFQPLEGFLMLRYRRQANRQ